VAPVIYPNPVRDQETFNVQLTLSNPADVVDIKVFTTAFRKVIEQKQVPASGVISIELKDKSGTPMADGLYYVVIQTSQGRFVSKLLILR